jgi:hypothetical protein
MKSLTAALLLVLASIGPLAVRDAQAQVITPMRFRVPFAFIAGEATFPPGQYEIRPVSDDLAVLEILNSTAGQSALVLIKDGAPPQHAEQSELIFDKYGDTYVLKGIWDAENQKGVIVTSTHAEKRATKGTPTKEHVKQEPKKS